MILVLTGFPIAYAMARGAITGFYPYPFIDVPALGIARVIVNALAILAGFFAIAILLSLLVFIGEAARDAFDPRKTYR